MTTAEETTNGRLLVWDAPPQAVPSQEHREYYGGGIPGAYEPNMNEEWRLRWKAKLRGVKSGALRVEIRKSTRAEYANTVQIVITVFEDGGVVMSMNGRAGFATSGEWLELNQAVSEAVSAMQLWRARQDGQALTSKYAAVAEAADRSGEDHGR